MVGLRRGIPIKVNSKHLKKLPGVFIPQGNSFWFPQDSIFDFQMVWEY